MEDPKRYMFGKYIVIMYKKCVRRGKNVTTNNGKERKKTKGKKRLFL